MAKKSTKDNTVVSTDTETQTEPAKKEAKSGQKARNWTFVAYPESLPSNWLEVLEKTGLPIAISPLHDKDINEDGLPKKAHYHVMLCFDGPTSFSVVFKLSNSLNQTRPEVVMSIKGMYDYLTHRNNPEKAQYDTKDIQHLNGFSILNYDNFSPSEKEAIYDAIEQIIIEKDISEYWDLILFLRGLGNVDYLRFARSNTIYFDRIIASKRHKAKSDQEKPSVANLISRLTPDDIQENLALIVQKVQASKDVLLDKTN